MDVFRKGGGRFRLDARADISAVFDFKEENTTKKLLTILLVVLLLCTMIALAGCGSMSIGIGNYEYRKVHVDTYHHSGCLTVEN